MSIEGPDPERVWLERVYKGGIRQLTPRAVLSGMLLAYECGMRFLTDHLEGDIYFRIHHDGQNLSRARTQFALVNSLEERAEELSRLVESVAAEGAD